MHYAARLIGRFFEHDLKRLSKCLFVLGVVTSIVTPLYLYFTLHLGQSIDSSPTDGFKAFVPGPKTRGTLNIIWVCASTIFTSVYLSVHVDVPDKPQKLKQLDKNAGFRKRIRRWVKIAQRFLTYHPACRRARWMLFNIIAPGLLVLTAVMEVISANDAVKYMHSRGQEDWNMKLAFFADMGGFQLEDEQNTVFPDGESFLVWVSEGPSGMLNTGPLLDEINDRRNANVVLKVFTCLQAVWLAIETIARLAEKKPVSELEITTCTYILCTIVTYACWLHKPYGIEERVVIRNAYITPRGGCGGHSDDSQPIDSTPPPRRALEEPRQSYLSSKSEPTQASESGPDALDKDYSLATSEPMRPPRKIFDNARETPFNRSFLKRDRAWMIACLASAFVDSGVGLIHGIAFWNTTIIFSTSLWLWRASCIVQVAVPIILGLCPLIERFYDGAILLCAMFFLASVFCVARATLFVLIWMSFWHLPDGIFSDVDWSWSYFPHWH
ncbi:hypothetical protein PsYK624_001410 [Phanerochaete sordida]|uniref:Uncharacterized protein n=1 Tax=Phanerochaete sordida TaxID=48140 RepID=A0A9P3FWU6_9APHY|nr:hypothetical protein PsYK624_001410 [Phanerochaete sordida]